MAYTFNPFTGSFDSSSTTPTLSFNEGTKYLSIVNSNKVSLSALVDSADTDTSVRDLTANWQNTYTTVSSDSSNWNSVYTSVKNTSANWDLVYTSVKDTSGNWDSVYNTVNSLSGNWDSVYSSVTNTSANWDSVYTTTKNTSGSFATNTLLQSTSSLLTPFTTTSSLTGSILSTVQLNYLPLSGGSLTGLLSSNSNITTPSLSTTNIYGSSSQTVFTDGTDTSGNGNNTLTMNYQNGIFIGRPAVDRASKIYLYSPNGSRYSISVTNTGVISAINE
jgi:hypothetical protein